MNRKERRAWMRRMKAQNVGNGIHVMDRSEVPEGTCDICKRPGKELRPYGPNGEWLCFDCAMKDKATTAARFRSVVFGDETH